MLCWCDSHLSSKSTSILNSVTESIWAVCRPKRITGQLDVSIQHQDDDLSFSTIRETRCELLLQVAAGRCVFAFDQGCTAVSEAPATADKCVGMAGRVGIPVEVVQLECRMVAVHVCSAVHQQPLPLLPLPPLPQLHCWRHKG